MLSFKSQDNFHFLLNILSCFPDIFLSCRNSNPIVLTLRCTNIYEWVIEWVNIFQSSCAGSHGHDLIVLDETRPLSCLLKNPNISAVKNPSNQNASSLTLLVRQLPVRTHKDLIFFFLFFSLQRSLCSSFCLLWIILLEVLAPQSVPVFIVRWNSSELLRLVFYNPGSCACCYRTTSRLRFHSQMFLAAGTAFCSHRALKSLLNEDL